MSPIGPAAVIHRLRALTYPDGTLAPSNPLSTPYPYPTTSSAEDNKRSTIFAIVILSIIGGIVLFASVASFLACRRRRNLQVGGVKTKAKATVGEQESMMAMGSHPFEHPTSDPPEYDLPEYDLNGYSTLDKMAPTGDHGVWEEGQWRARS